MNRKEFKERLTKELGANVTMATVRNWEKKGLIPKCTRMTKKERKRQRKLEMSRKLISELHAPTIRELEELVAKNVLEDDPVVPFGFFDEPFKIKPVSGYLGDSDEKIRSVGKPKRKRERCQGYFADCSEDALIETAAVWALKNCNCDCKGKNKIPPKAVTPKIIGTVQLIAREVLTHPHPYYRITERMIDNTWPDNPFTYKDVEMKLVSDDKFNQLTRAYIAAALKARHGFSVIKPMRTILKLEILDRTAPDERALLATRLAKLAKEKDRKLTPGEVRRAKQAHERIVKGTSDEVRSHMRFELERTDAQYDEIELWVREPGGEWADSRKTAFRASE